MLQRGQPPQQVPELVPVRLGAQGPVEPLEGVVRENAPVPVLWAQYWGSATCGDGTSGGWSVASGNTWYSEIIEAAGGSLIVPAVEAACESWGAPYLSTAQLLEVGADAAVIEVRATVAGGYSETVHLLPGADGSPPPSPSIFARAPSLPWDERRRGSIGFSERGSSRSLE